jgi:uncharacterized protein YqgC (DUF456 family)
VDALLWVAAVALVFVGLVGVILPGVPGTVLVFAGLMLAAWTDGFARVSVGTLVLLGILGAASYGIDFVAAALGAKHLGASRRAMAGAALGTLLGLMLGLPGVIIGPFVGAVLGELTVNRDLARAGRMGVAAWIGFAIGTAVKVGLVFVMLGVFLTAFLFF